MTSEDAADEVLIDWDGVGLTFPGAIPVEALRPTSIQIGADEYLSIRGASGSGKSTMLSLIGLIHRPTCGTFRFMGRDVTAADERATPDLRAEHLGFVFQAFHLLPFRSALDNVALGLMYRGVPTAEARERAAEALDTVGLRARREHRPAELSGGQSQRVAIARAIVGNPSILLADEPTGNLDRSTSSEVMDLFDAIRRPGTTLIIVTHDDSVAARASRHLEVVDGVVHEAAPVALP